MSLKFELKQLRGDRDDDPLAWFLFLKRFMSRRARPAQFLASVHRLDGDQLMPPRVVRCVILEPNAPKVKGEFHGLGSAARLSGVEDGRASL